MFTLQFRLSYMHTSIFLLSVLFFLTSCGETNEKPLQNKEFSAKHLVDSLKIPQESLSIFVDKSDFKLCLMNNDDTLKQYKVVLGHNPVDDKRMEGDKCTPEGVFKIRDLYPHKSWSKFIWFDYPNEESQKKFNASKAKGEIPSDATIGGEVGIHGVPEGGMNLIYENVNWTFGCVSLGTDDINDLYAVCYPGMKVKIQK